MTEQELQELVRLEYNVRRLSEVVTQQTEAIQRLRSQLSESREAERALRTALEEAQRQCRTAEVAASLATASGDSSEASRYLCEIIKEIEDCLSLLRASR